MPLLSPVHWQSIRWFVLLGPPFGLAALVLAIWIGDPTGSPDSTDLVQVLLICFAGLPYSYLIGAVPALLASLLFGTALSVGSSTIRQRTIPCLLLGVACGVVGTFVLLPFFGTGDGAYLTLFWIGGFSGGWCGLILGIRGVRTINSQLPDSQRLSD